MSDLFEQIVHTVDDALSDKDELVHKEHYKRDHIMLAIRNLLVGGAALLFVVSFIFDELSHIDIHHILKGIAYFCGAVYDDNVIGKIRMSVDSVTVLYQMFLHQFVYIV